MNTDILLALKERAEAALRARVAELEASLEEIKELVRLHRDTWDAIALERKMYDWLRRNTR